MGLFLVLFSVFSMNHCIFSQQINVKKCPSSILCQDSNSQLYAYESPCRNIPIFHVLAFT